MFFVKIIFSIFFLLNCVEGSNYSLSLVRRGLADVIKRAWQVTYTGGSFKMTCLFRPNPSKISEHGTSNFFCKSLIWKKWVFGKAQTFDQIYDQVLFFFREFRSLSVFLAVGKLEKKNNKTKQNRNKKQKIKQMKKCKPRLFTVLGYFFIILTVFFCY